MKFDPLELCPGVAGNGCPDETLTEPGRKCGRCRIAARMGARASTRVTKGGSR